MTMHGENNGSRKVEPEMQGLPKWRLMANFLQRELARVWYGKTDSFSGKFSVQIREFLFEFAADKGFDYEVFAKKAYSALSIYEWRNGDDCFKTPGQEVMWMAKNCLPEHLSAEFLSDPQVDFVLTATDLIVALRIADLPPPYQKYAVCFRPLAEYESLPVLTEERPS